MERKCKQIFVNIKQKKNFDIHNLKILTFCRNFCLRCGPISLSHCFKIKLSNFLAKFVLLLVDIFFILCFPKIENKNANKCR